MKYLTLFIVITLFMVTTERLFIPETTDEMRADARSYGEEHDKAAPPLPFRYDGCTLFPDQLPGIDLRDGCLGHDFAYYHGGTDKERKAADTRLKEAVANQGVFGQIMQYPVYIGVRLGGNSFLTRIFNANWGFGYNK